MGWACAAGRSTGPSSSARRCSSRASSSTCSLFSWVTSPNYFGEMVEWVGFALAAQTLAGWAFAVFTFANLAPRAVAHHKWYRATFADYPTSRRALIPFVW